MHQSYAGQGCGRAAFLKGSGLGFAATAFAVDTLATAGRASAAGTYVAPAPAANTPEAALTLLESGNARFVAGNGHCGPLTARRVELETGQSPFAIILSCSDSRVPIETIFDQVPGHIFSVRVAGNFLDDNGLGSIEYSIAVLKSPLVVVLGHSSCGAVGAAVSYVKSGTTQPGKIQLLVSAIAPAAKATKGAAGDWIANAVAENVKINVAAMTARSKIVSQAVRNGSVRVVGGVYELHTGRVIFS